MKKSDVKEIVAILWLILAAVVESNIARVIAIAASIIASLASCVVAYREGEKKQ